MRITLMNASPKGDSSASKQLLDRLIPFLKDDEYGILEITPNMDEKMAVAAVNASDAIVIASPIYVDGLPSTLLAFLADLEVMRKQKDIKCTAVLQCGFAEAVNTELAVTFLENYCRANKMTWIGGIGIGEGGMLTSLANMKTGSMLLHQLKPAYEALVQGLHEGHGINQFFALAMPRSIYQWAAELGWKKAIKAQGLEVKDLGYQVTAPNENFSKDSENN